MPGPKASPAEEAGFKKFFLYGMYAVFFYAAMSIMSHFIEGGGVNIFFNPGTSNLIIGLYVLFLFCLYGGKGLRKMDFFDTDYRASIALFALAFALMLGRAIFSPEDIVRKATSVLAAGLIVLSVIGLPTVHSLIKKYWMGLAFGGFMYFVIESYFSWQSLYMPVYMLIYAVFVLLGYPMSLEFTGGPPNINFVGQQIVAVPEISGVESLLVFVLFFLGVLNWNYSKILRKRFAVVAVAGFLGALFLVLLRTAFLLLFFDFYPGDFVYHLAKNPFNHFFYLAYSIIYWELTKWFVFPHNERGKPRKATRLIHGIVKPLRAKIKGRAGAQK